MTVESLPITFADVYAVPGEGHIIDVIHPLTGLTAIQRETEEQVRARYPGAVRLTWAAWQAQQAERQHTPITWDPVEAREYQEMLEVLPPAAWIGDAFLVGEPSDHDWTTGQPRFQAYQIRMGVHLRASRPMTIAELRAILVAR